MKHKVGNIVETCGGIEVEDGQYYEGTGTIISIDEDAKPGPFILVKTPDDKEYYFYDYELRVIGAKEFHLPNGKPAKKCANCNSITEKYRCCSCEKIRNELKEKIKNRLTPLKDIFDD